MSQAQSVAAPNRCLEWNCTNKTLSSIAVAISTIVLVGGVLALLATQGCNLGALNSLSQLGIAGSSLAVGVGVLATALSISWIVLMRKQGVQPTTSRSTTPTITTSKPTATGSTPSPTPTETETTAKSPSPTPASTEATETAKSPSPTPAPTEATETAKSPSPTPASTPASAAPAAAEETGQKYDIKSEVHNVALTNDGQILRKQEDGTYQETGIKGATGLEVRFNHSFYVNFGPNEVRSYDSTTFEKIGCVQQKTPIHTIDLRGKAVRTVQIDDDRIHVASHAGIGQANATNPLELKWIYEKPVDHIAGEFVLTKKGQMLRLHENGQFKNTGMSNVSSFIVDGDFLVVGFLDGALRSYNVKAGSLKRAQSVKKGSKASHTAPVTAIIATEKHIFSLSYDMSRDGRTMFAREKENFNKIIPFEFSSSSECFATDGHHLFAARKYGVSSLDLGKEIETEENGMGKFTSRYQHRNFQNDVQMITAIASDGTHLYTGTETGEIGVFDIATQKQLYSFKAHEGMIRSLKWASDQLISGAENGTLNFWKID